MIRRGTKLRALLALGPSNLAKVGWYRARLRFGVHPVQKLRAMISSDRLFGTVDAPPRAAHPGADWRATGLLFGRHPVAADRPPAWSSDLITGRDRSMSDTPWWRISDFAGDDIKTLWEPSRLNWLIPFAQRARNGEAAELERIEVWLRDWIAANPPYLGPNWKCAQEASIRVLHLAVAALILDQDRTPTVPLRQVLHAHLSRIVPTLGYAAAQDNNHATSEAAALYVGGHWLAAAGDRRGERLAALGRAHLERSVARLFAADGSFSQYSVTYHRLALDTLSIAEVWRRRYGDAAFGRLFQDRAAAAADWLRHLVDERSGDAPNIGANDGAELLQLGHAYRDFRPSVQLATTLFAGERAYPSGPWDDACAWLGLDLPEAVARRPGSRRFDDGGYAVLRRGDVIVVMRYPRFRFRPGHADPLHVDLWIDGRNLIRDGGTFSYNTDADTMDYFAGIQSHSTIQFDGEEPMPRVGRFLFGDWLRTEQRSEIADGRFEASYRDSKSRRHRRGLALGDGMLRVTDTISAPLRSAALRWRLAPGDWTLSGCIATDGQCTISIAATQPFQARLATGQESRHYLDRTNLPVLEIEVEQEGVLTTEIRWRP